MFRKIVSFVMALSIGVCAVGSASADVSSNMNGYWSNSLGAVSVTGPTAYQGQQGGYYSLGNIAVRTPQETTQVAAISMPQISGGCGGIDLYSGAMSFIGADQLISTIKGIASNAAPYAFMLALSLISSPISDQLKTFQDWAQKMNQFNISSCEQAQKLVDGTAEKILGGQDQFCQRLGRAKGTFSDAVAARNGCGSKSLAANASASSADLKWSPINRNIAWEAIMGNSLLSSDLQMAQLMQTMTGSYIIRCPNDATGVQSCVQTILPAEAAKDSVLTVILDGGTLKVHKCDTTTACLNPVKDGLTVTISTAPTCTSDASSCSLKAKVSLMLTSIVEKIRTRQALTETEVRFVNMTSIPVLKMASVYASQQGVGSDVVLQQYSDVIAIDIAYGWLMNNIRKVEEGGNALTGINQDQLSEWRSATAQVRQELLDRQTLVQGKVVAITDIVQRTQAAEQALNAQVKTRLGESLRFSQSLSQ